MKITTLCYIEHDGQYLMLCLLYTSVPSRHPLRVPIPPVIRVPPRITAAITSISAPMVLLNYARDLLVDEDAVLAALKAGKMKKYVTDFANPKVVGVEGTIVTPHLGASTKESEDNCAVMAVKEIRDFLENGNIRNSVNFPNCSMGVCTGAGRVTICHKNIPGMLGAFTTVMGNAGVNISDMTNKVHQYSVHFPEL